MRAFIVAAAAAVLVASAAGPAAATDASDVMTVINDYNAALAKGDLKSAAADCVAQLSIIDEFAPHSWQGPRALAKWFDSYAVWAKQNAVTGGVIALSQPWHVEIDGDSAYAVVPATYTYAKSGSTVVESGSVWTFALRKTSSGWRIASWAWAEH